MSQVYNSRERGTPGHKFNTFFINAEFPEMLFLEQTKNET